MATALQHLDQYDPDALPSGENLRIGVVTAEWNRKVTFALRDACLQTLIGNGVSKERITSVQVPGSFELPSAAQMLLEFRELDAVICLGCVIKGETRHDEYINHAVAQGLTDLTLQYGTPVIFGVLTTEDEDQAKARAGGKHGNKGTESAVTALRMAGLQQHLAGSEG
jgi:6,7-dimethyl-8-ribityllumazine synthase